MDVYSVIALIIRAFLGFTFWREGHWPGGPLARRGLGNIGNIIMLASAVSLFLGFFVYLVTLITLIYLGLRIWEKQKRGVRFGRDLFFALLTLTLFLKGPGAVSLDKLLGNIL